MVRDYPIIWVNDPPRHDLDEFVYDRLIGSEPKGLSFHHIPILNDDYDGPAILVSEGGGGKSWRCEHVIPISDLRDDAGDLPEWLQTILEDAGNE